MLCPFCGTYGGSEDVICPACGKLLPRGENRDSGVMAIRQGRRAREEAQSSETPVWQKRQGTDRVWVDPDTRPTSGGQIPVYPDADIFEADGTPVTDSAEIERSLRREVYDDAGESQELYDEGGDAMIRRRRSHPMRKHGVNWMIVLVIAGVLFLGAAGGAIYWVTSTPAGQAEQVRRGRDVDNAEVYWQVGEELMNTGDLEGAIAKFTRAKEIEENSADGRVNIDGLMMLATCYLRTDRTDMAEELYVHIYTDLNPTSEEAYRREIELMRENGREAEAANLMLTAYQKTGSSTFSRQRKQMLPSEPVTTLTAAVFKEKRTLTLTSPEDYPIYYVMNDSEVPVFDEGYVLNPAWIKYENGIFLDEGTWNIRAVCVNGSLCSDEFAAIYKINLPQPHQPNIGLAPGKYKKASVALWPNAEDKDEQITIYYTVDGSIPDADSPIYDGTKVKLKARKITIKVLAVNSYGKASPLLERNFEITGEKDPPMGYATNNPKDIATIRLNSTTYEAFSESFGPGSNGEDVTLGNLGECRRYQYSWGYATFKQVGSARYIVELYHTTNEIDAPRSTKIGMTEQEITSKFRDMGQVESPSGNRGLYSNGDGIGKIFKQEDGTKIIRYIAFTADGHYWQLDYTLGRDGTVSSIYHLYIP